MTEEEFERPWEIYLKYGERQYIEKGTILYNQGDVESGFYYVDKGLVKVQTVTYDGEEKSLGYHGPGQLFGELAIIERPYFSTASAVEDSVIYFLTRKRFKEMIEVSEEPLRLFLASLITKITLLLEQVLLDSPLQQVSYALLKLSEVSNKKEVFITQEDLAKLTGLTRMTIYKVLKDLKEREIITTPKRSIHILDSSKLADLSKTI